MGFPRQEYSRGLPFPSRGDPPHPGIKPTSPCIGRQVLYHWPRGNEFIQSGMWMLIHRAYRLLPHSRIRAKTLPLCPLRISAHLMRSLKMQRMETPQLSSGTKPCSPRQFNASLLHLNLIYHGKEKMQISII